ncbi:hypothetical protein CBR_g39507 [Chara braunii]|uniref:beta-galactoside alpha-(2,6)-sialyltransferase n=1 Tax=Chara braunii TaxID=69332 RepID=A0A388LS60_CHABU|nr:hypothetical protein CBR_g39507 [Chara braunii]|eukprot:GBG85043.1 hypothetical protein CBR_g39507 [Chara braunii]
MKGHEDRRMEQRGIRMTRRTRTGAIYTVTTYRSETWGFTNCCGTGRKQLWVLVTVVALFVGLSISGHVWRSSRPLQHMLSSFTGLKTYQDSGSTKSSAVDTMAVGVRSSSSSSSSTKHEDPWGSNREGSGLSPSDDQAQLQSDDTNLQPIKIGGSVPEQMMMTTTASAGRSAGGMARETLENLDHGDKVAGLDLLPMSLLGGGGEDGIGIGSLMNEFINFHKRIWERDPDPDAHPRPIRTEEESGEAVDHESQATGGGESLTTQPETESRDSGPEDSGGDKLDPTLTSTGRGTEQPMGSPTTAGSTPAADAVSATAAANSEGTAADVSGVFEAADPGADPNSDSGADRGLDPGDRVADETENGAQLEDDVLKRMKPTAATAVNGEANMGSAVVMGDMDGTGGSTAHLEEISELREGRNEVDLGEQGGSRGGEKRGTVESEGERGTRAAAEVGEDARNVMAWERVRHGAEGFQFDKDIVSAFLESVRKHREGEEEEPGSASVTKTTTAEEEAPPGFPLDPVWLDGRVVARDSGQGGGTSSTEGGQGTATSQSDEGGEEVSRVMLEVGPLEGRQREDGLQGQLQMSAMGSDLNSPLVRSEDPSQQLPATDQGGQVAVEEGGEEGWEEKVNGEQQVEGGKQNEQTNEEEGKDKEMEKKEEGVVHVANPQGPVSCLRKSDCSPGRYCIHSQCVCPVLFSGNDQCTEPSHSIKPGCVVPMNGERMRQCLVDHRLRPGDSYLARRGGRELVENADFETCAVVGSAASIINSQGRGRAYGREIDSHTAVIRFNDAPTKGYEKWVGSKTTLRVQNFGQCGFVEHPGELCMRYTAAFGASYNDRTLYSGEDRSNAATSQNSLI